MATLTRASLHRRGLVWVVAVVGVALSLFIWLYASRSETARIRTGFLSRAQTQAAVAAQQLRSYEEMVHSLRDSFLGQNTVTRGEFTRVAQSIFQRHHGVQALQWVQILNHAERGPFEKTTSHELGRPVVITRRFPDETLRPAPSADEYFVISYVEPLAGNEPVLGYDVTSAPSAPLLRAARQDRKFKVSPSMRLAQSTAAAAQPGVIFILPLWRDDVPGQPVEGFVQGVFRLQTMLAQSHQLTTNEALDTYYFDVTDSEPGTFLYANRGGLDSLGPPTDRLDLPLPAPGDYRETLQIGDRRWLMLIRQNADWSRRAGSRQPALILGFGLAITALLAFLIHSLLQRTARIEDEVRVRTRQLRESEARLQDIMDHSPAIIFLKDLDGRYQLCNHAFELFCARPRSAILGCRDEDLFPAAPAARAREHDLQVQAAGRPMEFEEASTDTPPRLYLAHKFPLLDEQGRIYALCGISTDITDRKAAEQQKLAFERKLLESQKFESLGVLAGGVAHDFNNILTAILGNATLVAMDLPDTHRARQQLSHIEHAAQRAGDLCAQMLAYAGRAAFVTAPVNLAALVTDTAALLEATVGRRVRLELLTDTTVPAVLGDATQLRQIVMNLVINAADAMADRTDGHVIVRTFTRDLSAEFFQQAVQSPTLPAGRYVGIEVSDNGSGMPPAVMDRIFEPFFTTKFSGRGLGLAAVRGIVQSHNGALFVESAPDRGTVFRLFLPATNAVATGSAPPFIPGTSPLHGTVLVVDDEDPVRQVARDALTLLGLTVHEAADGPAALALVQAAPDTIDLVLLDLTMPGLAGDEVLRRLRQIRPDLKVIIMSGYSEGETMQRCAASGVSGYLPKPFAIAELGEKLRQLLG
ncbi:Blue-light-activated protein [Lacunisphaera limnophila]|uniref:histidine kinase n=1 Tax=Lacunisphaera limnophila TaxID=1838286 RepID=A0A1D8AVM5_9BACT|nr:CHASE domain-containing protein [Lacunisphaera limnophila]AOS44905.1 Blue-light-activated protein [Lacunisphaera limnophila]